MRSENRIRDAFERIGASEELKAATKEYLQTVRQREEGGREGRKERRSGPRFGLWRISAAACALLLFLGMGGYVMLAVPVAYVSIDVNPSIELTLNRLDRVMAVRAYNLDGEKVLEGLSVWGTYYTDAIDRVVESVAMRPYLTENGDLTFTVASVDGGREERLFQGIKNCSGCWRHGGRSYRTDIGFLEEAHENGLSLGKYAAYKILEQYDTTVTAEDCHGMAMWEIRARIQEHEDDGGTGGHGNGGHDNGRGNGHGGHGGHF